jgi:putative oxidoreductase
VESETAMTTPSMISESSTRRIPPDTRPTAFLVPLGRLLFAAIFLFAGVNHFSPAAIGYAGSQGVPSPQILVPLSGILALAAGLSVLVGFRARIGAALIVAFLVPVTLMMHRFWAITDPMQAQMQLTMFMKNVTMMGGALYIAYFGSGPVSVDAWLGARGAATEGRHGRGIGGHAHA